MAPSHVSLWVPDETVRVHCVFDRFLRLQVQILRAESDMEFPGSNIFLAVSSALGDSTLVSGLVLQLLRASPAALGSEQSMAGI